MKECLKLTSEEQKKLYNNFLQAPETFYEKNEMDQLRIALKRSTKERFLVMTSLMKTNLTLSQAKITINKGNSDKA